MPNLEVFKIDLKRGIESLLPWAKQHAQQRRHFTTAKPENIYSFPPYHLIFTIEVDFGGQYLMASVSAPHRPIKILDREERRSAIESIQEMFPDYDVFPVRNLLPVSAAFKLVGFPPGSPGELVQYYRSQELPLG